RKEKTEIVEEYKLEYGDNIIKPKRKIPMFIGSIVAGLVLLVLGSHLLVDSSVIIARYFNVSKLLIGLTIIAVGTSLPELATSVIATLKGERDIAVGNVIGSNIFNLLAILGLAGLLSPNGINVSETALSFDLPFMIAVAVACLPIFFTGYIISRWEGGLFLAYYFVYIIYLYLATVSHKILPVYNIALIIFIVPITVITLIVLTYRSIKTNKLKT
nr:sodium:calcium antiporter [Bacteroidota bacterium]